MRFTAGGKEEARSIFKTWTGISILCPYLKPNEDIKLYGDPSMMIAKNYEIQVSRCNGTTHEGKPCKPLNVINKYLEDLEVSIWAAYEKMDFNEYKEMETDKPTFLL